MTLRGPRTLFWRLGLALMAVQAIVALAIGTYSYFQLREFHYRQTLAELERWTPMVSERVARALDGSVDELRSMQEATAELGSALGLRITVIGADGKVLADTHQDPAVMENHGSREEIAEAMREGAGNSIRHSSTVDLDMLYFVERIARPEHMDDEGELLFVRTALPLTRVRSELAETLRVITIAGVFLIGLTFIVTLLISRGLSRRVTDMAESAARFAAGDLQHRIARPTGRELAALADALNDMAGQLSRRIAQLQTQQSEQQAILESMSSGVIALDLDQRILNINRTAERFFGLSGAAARGRLLQEVIRQPELNRSVAAALETGNPVADEFTVSKPHENSRAESSPAIGAGASSYERILQTFCEPLIGGGVGTPRGLLIILNDITELRQFESLRSDFAANVSHELRTPITNIKGYVETLLEEGMEDHDQAERFLRVIQKNSGRLAAIVDDVMALSQLEQPQTRETLERRLTRIATIVHAVVGQYDAAASAKCIHIVRDVPTDLRAMVHPHLIEQAISNVLSNAINYSPPDTTVTISAETVGTSVVISVADEGPGIPAKDLSRIFERFYRVDRARSREVGGTGLGLAIVKHIALVHGGKVSVESEIGVGSTFRIAIPSG